MYLFTNQSMGLWYPFTPTLRRDIWSGEDREPELADFPTYNPEYHAMLVQIETGCDKVGEKEGIAGPEYTNVCQQRDPMM